MCHRCRNFHDAGHCHFVHHTDGVVSFPLGEDLVVQVVRVEGIAHCKGRSFVLAALTGGSALHPADVAPLVGRVLRAFLYAEALRVLRGGISRAKCGVDSRVVGAAGADQIGLRFCRTAFAAVGAGRSLCCRCIAADFVMDMRAAFGSDNTSAVLCTAMGTGDFRHALTVAAVGVLGMYTAFRTFLSADMAARRSFYGCDIAAVFVMGMHTACCRQCTAIITDVSAGNLRCAFAVTALGGMFGMIFASCFNILCQRGSGRYICKHHAKAHHQCKNSFLHIVSSLCPTLGRTVSFCAV